MGRDIHLHLVKFNRKENRYEEVKLYRKSKDGTYYVVDLFPGRDGELFDILNGNEDDYFPCRPIHVENLPSSLAEEIKKDINTFGYYDFKEANLADIKIYLKEHPKVRDWDYECEGNQEKWEKKAWKENPVKSLVRRIDYFIDFFDEYNWEYSDSDVRLIYWFDC